LAPIMARRKPPVSSRRRRSRFDKNK
jgi:hypothetical protein